jgi:hypothetical protein
VSEASHVLDGLKAAFSDRIEFREKRPGVMQLVAPLYHEDGDMIDVFLDLPKAQGAPFRISDHGLTLMRLSYSVDMETPAKRKVLDRVLSENGISEERGRFYVETTPEHLYPSILQFAQTVAKISSFSAFNQEVVRSMFYETLGTFVVTT